MVYRRITRATDFRTITATVVPISGLGDTSPIIAPKQADENANAVPDCLLANLNAFVCDYTARGKISGIHLDFTPFKQIAVFEPHTYLHLCTWNSTVDIKNWVRTRVLELTYTGERCKTDRLGAWFILGGFPGILCAEVG